MADNPFFKFTQPGTTVKEDIAPPEMQTSQPSASNPFFKFTQPGGGSIPRESPTPEAGVSSPVSGNPFFKFTAPSGGFSPAGAPISDEDQDRFTQENPDDNWLQKSWTLSNKPLTETLFGWGHYRKGAGGLERGVEKILAGMTAPLSLLTLAAFAPVGIADGVAGGVLKEGLTEGAESLGGEALSGAEAALKVENYARAMGAAQKARLAGTPIADAVDAATSGSMPYQEFLNYGKYLRNSGLRETDILPESLARKAISRGASVGLQKLGVTPKGAMAIAKGAETLINAGFGVQQITGAVYAFPRFLDLMQNGEYDKASEYLVEGGVGTIFGTLGIAGSLHSVQDILPGLNERLNLPISDETENLNRLFGSHTGALSEAQINISEQLRNHTLQMLDAAGIEAPARLKTGGWGEVSPMEELSSVWRDLLGNKEAREKVNDTQKKMFLLLDNGGDRQLSHQEMSALIYGYHLEPWAKENGLGEYLAPERDLETIRKEQTSQSLEDQALLRENVENQLVVNKQLLDLKSQIDKTVDPVTKSALSARYAALNQKLNELNIENPKLQQRYNQSKEWENPTESTWKRYYDETLAKVKKAVEPLKPFDPANPDVDRNALDDFNQRIKDLGLGRPDLDIIEKEFPHFRDAELRERLDRGRLPIENAAFVEPFTHDTDADRYHELLETKWSRGLSPEETKEFSDLLSRTGKDNLEMNPEEIRLAKVNQTPETQDEIEQLANLVEEHGISLAGALSTTPVSGQTLRAISNLEYAKFVKAGRGLLARTDTPEFKKFYGNSVLKTGTPEPGEEGEGLKRGETPMTLYHGTTASRENTAVYEGPTYSSEKLRQLARDWDKKDYSVDLVFQAMRVANEIDKGKSFQEAIELDGSENLATILRGKLTWGAKEPLDFEDFDPLKGDLGTHLGSPEQANEFVMRARGKGEAKPMGRILPVYARLENPLRLIDYGSWTNPSTVYELVNKGILDPNEADRILSIPFTEKAKTNLAIQRAIEAAGYDGVVYLNRGEGVGEPLSKYYERGETDEEFKTRNPNAHDSYIIFHKDQVKSAFNKGTYSPAETLSANRIFGEPAEKRFDKEIEVLRSKMQETQAAIGKVTKPEEAQEHIAKLQQLVKDWSTLQDEVRSRIGNYYGEVHQIPDGTKILYMAEEPFRELQKVFFKENYTFPMGQYLPKAAVDFAMNALRENPRIPYRDQIMKLLGESTNKDGQIVMSRDAESYQAKLSKKLWTLREELIHNWQGFVAGNTVAREHLSPEKIKNLYDTMPSGLRKFMDLVRYNKNANVRVLEGAAKLMAVNPEAIESKLGGRVEEPLTWEYLGVSPEEGRDFLLKYFSAIEEEHGEKAFDTLTHTTNYTKRLLKEYLHGRETKPEPLPVAGKTEGVVEGVQEGAGRPPTGPPRPPRTPEPPTPPIPPEEWWRKALRYSFPESPWLDGPLHPALPTDIFEKVDKTRARKFKEPQIDYVKKIATLLNDISRGNVSEKEQAFYKELRRADDENWGTGFFQGIIKSLADNHIHHIWGEKEDSIGNAVIEHALSGSFSINASQAKRRSWGTAFEGILQGRQLKVHDPTAIIAHDANNIATAAMNRKFLEDLVTSGLKDPEGMPIAVYTGAGYTVPGVDGNKAAEIINPHVVKKILMGSDEVSRLEKANLLKTYIKDGRVTDRTKSVNQDNVQDWIKSTQAKINKLYAQNPLLEANMERMTQHKAGWGQLNLFAKTQGEKIANYLDEVISVIKNNKSVDTIPKPADINMSKYANDILGRKVMKPSELDRLQEYADRNRQYAQGYSARKILDEDGERGFAEEPMRYYEVAQMLRQERQHLNNDPELVQYLESVHQNLGTDWSIKGLNTALAHVQHAAENPYFDQLMQDLRDLKTVNNVYTSVNPITQMEHKAEAEKLLADINARQPKEYLWSPKSHITIDHPSFHGYKWMATAEDGTPTLAESSIGVSRHYYNYIINRLGLEPSNLRQPKGIGKITGPMLKAGGEFKNVILSGSPFHIIQEGLRALMLGVNPFVRPNPIAHLDENFKTVRGNLPVLKLGVGEGLTVFNNRFEAEDYDVGVASHGGLVSKIPVWGKVSDQIHDLLFNRLLPSYKASGFRNMFDKYASAHPDWTNEAVARAAAEHTNAAFGGINWRAMGRSATTQDWFHLIALAPDWLESEMRFAASAMKGIGVGPAKFAPDEGRNFSREQIAATAVVLWTSARVLNLLYSGNAHYETPFGLATKDKNGREVEFSLRTMPTDVLHMATDPMGFLTGRESPLLRTGLEEFTGRNQYGQKLSDSEKYVDLVSNMLPIPYQAGLKKITNLATGTDVSPAEQVAKAAGVTAAIHRTPAQKTAANLASQRSEEGSMDPAKIAHHRVLLQLEDDLRAGRITNQDLSVMVDSGGLPIADAKNVIKDVRETYGEDPEIARMYSRVSRLDWAGALAVYDDSNSEEKQVLDKLIRKKASAYIKRARTQYTPQERAQDPLFKRAQRISPIIETEE